MVQRFNKILIANRGEIAVRIVRACHELGIKAVAVYSEADRTAMHVREADEAYPIGPAPAAESYLVPARLIETALKAGCQAIHPGYGFLAENAEFARLVNEAGLTYIGSSPESIRLLGDKVESRRAMAKAGVPITPGTEVVNGGQGRTPHRKTTPPYPPLHIEGGELDDALAKAAERIGYPVLVKAAGGGGGKGMRVVHNSADLKAAIEGASREAQSAFGNPTVYIEKFITEPRHIEFQIFGDIHGNRVHLFERECSIQRRHQKIIEECPSPVLDLDLRRRMGEAAVMVAETAGYFNAGTVEFLLDKDNNFYFLEVNTRIQVEHPVTEMVVGVDLVREQIRVAAGAELSWSQGAIRRRGHAIEARLYAEDAANGFLPAAGPVLLMEEPRGPGIRFDGGVETGDEVSVYYDPIIAKLIAWGEDREAAIRRLRRALDRTVILGLTTNIEFLKAVIDHPEFGAGRINTGFIPRYLPDWKPAPLPSGNAPLAAVLAYVTQRSRTGTNSSQVATRIPEPWQTIGAWQIAESRR